MPFCLLTSAETGGLCSEQYYTDHEHIGKIRSATKLGLMDRPSRLPDNIQLINQLVEAGSLVLTPSSDYDDSYCIAHARNNNGCAAAGASPLETRGCQRELAAAGGV